MRDAPKWPGNLEHRETYPKKSPMGLVRRDTENFGKKMKWMGRSKKCGSRPWEMDSHCKPSISTGVSGSSKWSDIFVLLISAVVPFGCLCFSHICPTLRYQWPTATNLCNSTTSNDLFLANAYFSSTGRGTATP